MANRRISELQELAGLDLADQDLLTVVHVFEVDPTLKNRKLTVSGTKEYLNVYYLPRTGGTVSGALVVQGNLTVSGSTNFATATFTGAVNVGSLIAQSGVTASGTISGATITGSNIQGTNVNGVLGNFTTITGGIINIASGNFLAKISGVTITGASGAFTSLTGQTITGTTVNVQTITGVGATFTTVTGNTAGFTTVTGVTVTGTSGGFVTLTSTTGNFTSLTGVTTTGTTATFTSGSFTSLTGVTTTVTSGIFALGSAAAPSITISGYLNTGIYSPGADQLAIATAGTGRLFVDANGNVGVGVTPAYRLDVANGNLSGAKLFKFTGATAGGSLFGYSDGGGVGITRTDPYNTMLYFDTSNDILFFTDGSEVMRINDNGKLLVGTSSPISVPDGQPYGVNRQPQFQIAGVSSTSVLSSIAFFNTSANSPDGAGCFSFSRSNTTTIGSHAIVSSGDVIGKIGYSASDDSGYLEAAAITAVVDGTPGAYDMPGRLVFSTTADGAASPTERMRIDSSGLTLFTASVASTNLVQVINNNVTPTGIGLEVNFTNATGTNTNTAYLYSGRSAGQQRFYVYGNGGIANYQANDVNLSDINTKKDISLAAGTWDCIKKWEIVNYRYKDQPDDADLNLGVIAQQVAESCPEVITIFQGAKEATEDAPAQEERLGVKEQQMYWMAIKALQEAIARIEILETRLSTLEGA